MGKGYRYYGVLLGIRFAGGDPGRKGYDCVVGMDSETFPHPPGTLGRVELHWRNTLGADTFDREPALREEDRKIYRFGDREAPHYQGYEAFMVRGRCGYCVRVLSSKQLFDANRDILYRLAEGIKII
ncbi:MAG TPA: hypothetical protein ENN21_08280 [Spirochaetes bacterium]|nr:hypothetical protein [Spirochaetota bacterium]